MASRSERSTAAGDTARQATFDQVDGEVEAEAARADFLRTVGGGPAAVGAGLSHAHPAGQQDLLLRLQADRGNAFVQRLVEQQVANAGPGRLVGRSQSEMVGEVHNRAGSGEPLPEVARAPLEGYFGTDLGDVRVHADEPAGDLAAELGAQAFTVGSDIFVPPAAYAPEEAAGQALLAHEVAHVGQQTGLGPAVQRMAVEVEPPRESAEEVRKRDAAAALIEQAPEVLSGQAPAKADTDPSAAQDVAGWLSILTNGAVGGAAADGAATDRAPSPPGAPAAQEGAPATEPGPAPTESGGNAATNGVASPSAAAQTREPVAADAAADGPNGAPAPAGQTAEVAAQAGAGGAQAAGADADGGLAAAATTAAAGGAAQAVPPTVPAPPAPNISASLGVDAANAPAAPAGAVASAIPVAPLTSQATPRGQVQAASFTEPDVATLLPPPQPDDDPQARAQAEDALRAELAADRARAQQSVDAFVEQRRSMTDELAALRPQLESEVAAAQTSALATIDASLEAQVAEVQAGVASAIAAAQAQSVQARTQVDAAHLLNTVNIQAATVRVRAALTEQSVAIAERASSAETAQLEHLETLYTQVEADFRAAADTAGALAVSQAAAQATTFRAGKIGHDDSFLDGPLTDNRCEAQADAAEKVGASYRDELRKEGDKQAEAMRARKPTDENAVHQVTTETRTSLAAVLDQAIRGVEDSERQSLANADAARDQLVAQVDDTLRATLAGLTQHETTQVAQLNDQAAARKLAVNTAAEQTVTGLGQAIEGAVVDVDQALATLVSQLGAGELPDVEVLTGTLAEAGAQLDAHMAALQESIRTQATQAVASVTDTGAQTVAELAQTGAAALEAARATGSGATDALTAIADQGSTALQGIADAHTDAAQLAETGYGTATTTVLDGQAQSFTRINDNLTQGAQRNVASVRQGLTQVVEQDMPGVITEEANKARAQVLPRWKSFVKWVIILAIVLAVAIVLGPLVIGAAAGAATALGASAIVGTIVGGALVGAATSAVITVVDNGFAGRSLTTGIGQAMLIGAIGGGIGGAAAGLLQGPMQGMTALGQFGVKVGVDMVIDTGLNAATGNLSWENFGTSLALSVITNGVTAHPRVAAFSEGLTSRGFGAGYDAAAGLRSRITGTGAPGSLGTVGIDADHVNAGDNAGPGSPYAGKWDMSGGGHNAGEFRGRIAAEGGGPADYKGQTVAKDPVTGVAIDEVTRNRLAGPPASPTIDMDPATGLPKTKTSAKSLFPPSMDRAAIQAAGQRGLELAVAGAPGTEHTPPPSTGGNGSFSAIITTPEGHPVRVQGYYSIDPATGQRVIQTVYPGTDLPGRTIPPVPGSRTNVPGAATPPNYHPGDDPDE